MKKIHLKLKALEWSQHFSHYKSMGIFQNAKGHVWSDPAEFRTIRDIMGFLLPARMKKIRSEMKALEWSQHYALIFHTPKGR